MVQSVPSYSPARIARVIKSITAREVFKRIPIVKEQLWGGEFWTKGYFVSTVSRHGDEDTITRYVKNYAPSENEYEKLHSQELQIELF